MKGNLIVGAAIAVGAVLSFSSSNAAASCASICSHVYQACITDGRTAPECRSEQKTCMTDCEGTSVTSQHRRTSIKDQNGQEVVLGQSRPATLIPLKIES